MPFASFRRIFQRASKSGPNAEGVLALTPHEIDQYEYSNDGYALAGVTWPHVCWNWGWDGKIWFDHMSTFDIARPFSSNGIACKRTNLQNNVENHLCLLGFQSHGALQLAFFVSILDVKTDRCSCIWVGKSWEKSIKTLAQAWFKLIAWGIS